jgi:hypothetical protein
VLTLQLLPGPLGPLVETEPAPHPARKASDPQKRREISWRAVLISKLFWIVNHSVHFARQMVLPDIEAAVPSLFVPLVLVLMITQKKKNLCEIFSTNLLPVLMMV